MIFNTATVNEIGKLLLVAHAAGLRDQIEKILPAVEIVEEANLLAGLVRLSRENFDVAVVQVLSTGRDMDSALRSYKRVNDSLKIILLTEMFDEPVALSLTQRGLADDYLILPLYENDLNLTLRRLTPPPVKRTTEEIHASLLPRRIAPPGDIQCLDIQQAIIRELADIIGSAQLSLKPLLERICWSAVYLFKGKGARLTLGQEIVTVGKESDHYEHRISLIDDGREIGKLEVLTDGAEIANLCFEEYLVQLIPGLIRLASSRGELQELANTDPLTGLANRRHLQEMLQNLVERAQRERFRVTLVLFDFDNFKHYNDTYGHCAGDEILREAGMLLNRCIHPQDFAARYGGDEIAVVLWDYQERRIPNSEHPRSAMAIMSRFRKLLKEHYFTRLGPQIQGSLTISGGLASFPWDAGNIDELIERADQALLEAKRSGKDRIYLVGQGSETNLMA